MATLTIRLHPADVLMFRESRWFGTSAAASSSVFPTPRTVAGALRAYMMDANGADYAKVRAALDQVRRNTSKETYLPTLKAKLRDLLSDPWPVDASVIGPFLGTDGLRHYPAPKTIVCKPTQHGVGDLAALRPVEATWLPSDSLRPLAAPALPAWEALPEIWMDEGNLTRYLSDGQSLPDGRLLDDQTRDRILGDELRVGVGLNSASFTAENGLLYTSTFTRLRESWYLEADVAVNEMGVDALRELTDRRPWLRLGGDAKVVRVEITDRPHTSPPPPASTAAKPFLYLATPALFTGGSDWSSTSSLKPIAVATGRPLAVSGWDLAANLPMWSRYAVPAGAVFFLDSAVTTLQDPHNTCISDDPDDRASGWGYCLRGAW